MDIDEESAISAPAPEKIPAVRRKNAPVLFTRRRQKQRTFTYHMQAVVISTGVVVEWTSEGLEDLCGLRQKDHKPSDLTAVKVLRKW